MGGFQQLEFFFQVGGSDRVKTYGANGIERAILIPPVREI
jgi:hypothetical protein